MYDKQPRYKGSLYRIVKTGQLIAPGMPKIVWIEDLKGEMSVTNDAERVVAEVLRTYPGYRIIYKDSIGNWDELIHRDGEFVGFQAARHLPPPL